MSTQPANWHSAQPADAPARPIRSWSPSAALLALVALIGLIALAAAVLTPDRVAMLFLLIAALITAAVTLSGSFGRPRLALYPDHLSSRTLLRTHRWERADIRRIRATGFARLGRTTRLLELDVCTEGEDQLTVFSRWDLGEDPRAVADILAAHGWPVEHPE